MLETVVMDRIRELLMIRQWYRLNRWATWTDLRRENEVELRALVRLSRTARRLTATQPDPITLAGGYAEWTQGELQEAFGR